jgi:ABC-2 type transport system permease protein
MLVSPTPNWVIVAGYAMGGVARGILVGVIIFAISIFFVHPVIYNGFIVALFVFLTAVVFSLGGLINGIFATKFDDVSIFPTFVLTPLTYFGGVFYSIKDLPSFWQLLTKFNPILYMVDGFRYGFFGFSDVDVGFSIMMLLIFTLVLVVAALYLLKKGTGLKS